MPILAELRVSYEGEPLALLVGPDPDKARELARGVEVSIAEEEPFLSYEKFSSDQIEARKGFERGSPRGFFGRAASSIFEGKYKYASKKPFMASILGAAASIQGRKLVIDSPSPWPFHARTTVSEFLGIDPGDIVVRATSRPRAEEGPLLEHSRIAALCAFASLMTKSSAYIDMSLGESSLWQPREPLMLSRIKTSHLESGLLAAADIQITIEVGAYGIFSEELAERACAAALGPYHCENVRVEVFCVSTNDLPVDSIRDTCIAGAQLFMETHIARYIRSLDLDPIAFREASMPRGEGDANLTRDGRNGFSALLTEIDRISAYSRKHASFILISRSKDRGALEPRRGIGISIAASYEGMLSAKADDESGFSVELEIDKESALTLRTGIDAEASGVADLWRRIASEAMGIEADAISIPRPSTDKCPNSGPACFGRPRGIITAAIEKGLDLLQKQRFRKPLPIKVSIPLAPKKRSPRKPACKALAVCVLETESDLSQHFPCVKGCWMTIEAQKDMGSTASTLESASFHALASAMLDASHEKPGPWLRMPFRAVINGATFEPWALSHALILPAYAQALSMALNVDILSLPASHGDSLKVAR
jgi:CO/xanthine dehydrogenase Mo-binding subunit